MTGFPVSETTLAAQVLQRLQVLQVEDHEHYTYPGLRREERFGEQVRQTHTKTCGVCQQLYIYNIIYTHIYIYTVYI